MDEKETRIGTRSIDCATLLCPPAYQRMQPWISDECLDLAQEQKQMKHVDFNRYCQLNREVRRITNADQEAYWNIVAAELEGAASQHEYRVLYQTLKRMRGGSKLTNDNIKKVDETFIKYADERLQHWWEFFQHHLDCEPPHGPETSLPYIDPSGLPCLIKSRRLMR